MLPCDVQTRNNLLTLVFTGSPSLSCNGFMIESFAELVGESYHYFELSRLVSNLKLPF